MKKIIDDCYKWICKYFLTVIPLLFLLVDIPSWYILEQIGKNNLFIFITLCFMNVTLCFLLIFTRNKIKCLQDIDFFIENMIMFLIGFTVSIYFRLF